ncbi:TetR/AcrR family transcriptional regulator [Streptomyces sp. NPDC055078]
MTPPPTTPNARPGRPPDQEIEPKVIAAALDIYERKGWAGFTIDEVARESRVGKAAIYRRWVTKQDLVAAAIISLKPEKATVLSGPLRDDLLLVADNLSRRYFGERGLVMLRALVEAKVYPEVLGEALERSRLETIAAGRGLVVGALERGELPEGTSPAIFMNALVGAILHQMLVMPADRMARLAAEPREFTERLVDFVLAGAGWTPAEPSDEENTG